MTARSSEEQSSSPNAEGVSAGNAGLDEQLQTPPGSDERLIEKIIRDEILRQDGGIRMALGIGDDPAASYETIIAHATARISSWVQASLLRVTEERDALAAQTWDSIPKQEALDIETRARAVHAAFMAETARRADVERELEEKSANEARLASRCRELELLLDSEARRRKYLSGELGEYERREVYPAGKDHRTPQAQKWPDDYIPPTTCGSIDDVQNALESIRDTNSQLRHVAYHALASLSALRGEVGKGLEPERLAAQFHEAYERLAPQFAYKTRVASAVPWEEVPSHNKRLMIAVATEIAASLLSTLEGNTVSRAIIAGSNSTVETDNPSSTGKWPPEPPWPVGSDTNSKIVGWEAFFAGKTRDECPFPPSSASLWRRFREGWDAAKAADRATANPAESGLSGLQGSGQ